VRDATTNLLDAAQHILVVAMMRGVQALQRPPAPALLGAVAAACREPLLDGSPAEQQRKRGAHRTACMALMVIGDANAASLPPSPPLSPQHACAALTAHLGETLQGLGQAP
jgi:hypothetical protein